LLDTNACIALVKGKPAAVRLSLQRALDAGSEVLVPTVVAFELWYGVAKSADPEGNAKRIEAFLAGPVRLLPFEDEDARTAGQVRAALEIAGKPIGAYDVLIAGLALRHQLKLVTANAKEFARVKGLVWEDWAKI
jgi:tRNA(fMet)-specific endonuclease VapC